MSLIPCTCFLELRVRRKIFDGGKRQMYDEDDLANYSAKNTFENCPQFAPFFGLYDWALALSLSLLIVGALGIVSQMSDLFRCCVVRRSLWSFYLTSNLILDRYYVTSASIPNYQPLFSRQRRRGCITLWMFGPWCSCSYNSPFRRVSRMDSRWVRDTRPFFLSSQPFPGYLLIAYWMRHSALYHDYGAVLRVFHLRLLLSGAVEAQFADVQTLWNLHPIRNGEWQKHRGLSNTKV